MSRNLLGKYRVSRKKMVIRTLGAGDDEDIAYWQSQSLAARMRAMELMRQINYGQAGEKRLIYGSNWPVSDQAAPYATVHGIVRTYFQERGKAATGFARKSEIRSTKSETNPKHEIQSSKQVIAAIGF